MRSNELVGVLTTRRHSGWCLLICALMLIAGSAFGQWTAATTPGYIFTNSGVGIGTSAPNPSYSLDISSTLGSRIFTSAPTGFGGMTVQNDTTALGAFLTLGSGRSDVYAGIPAANWTVFLTTGAASNGFIIQTFTPRPLVFGTNNAERIRIDGFGNVGIGTKTPTAALDVNGSINVSGNIAAKYQDIAEWVPSEASLDAGTVVVLSTDLANHVTRSVLAYDTKVAGVISDRPGLILGEARTDSSKVATSGRVKVKVDATRHPLRIGDLLVTSDTPGYAMYSEPLDLGGIRLHRPGTIVGKALEPLAEGRGEILVLLSLQ
jgi:hypothetical protein